MESFQPMIVAFQWISYHILLYFDQLWRHNHTNCDQKKTRTVYWKQIRNRLRPTRIMHLLHHDAVHPLLCYLPINDDSKKKTIVEPDASGEKCL